MVVVGERGIVLLSDDRGATWKQAKVPTRALLTAVYFHDARLGWVVGHDETILRSEDGGETWTRTHAAPDREQPLLDVWFKDTDTGFAFGAYGTILVLILTYVAWLGRLQSTTARDLDRLQKALDRAPAPKTE